MIEKCKRYHVLVLFFFDMTVIIHPSTPNLTKPEPPSDMILNESVVSALSRDRQSSLPSVETTTPPYRVSTYVLLTAHSCYVDCAPSRPCPR